jgi:hypothetical protein
MIPRIRHLAAAACVALLAGYNLPIQYRYLAETTRANQATATLLERLAALPAIEPRRSILLDITDPSFPRIVSLYTRGHPTTIVAGNGTLGVEGFIQTLGVRARDARVRGLLPYGSSGIPETFDRVLASMHPQRFPLPSGDGGILEFTQITLPGVPLDNAILIAPAADESVVNDSTSRPATGHYYARDLAEVHNHLALIDASLGHVILPGVIEDVALWQREPDFFDSRGGTQATGRYLLFQVLNPVPGSRLMLGITSAAALGGRPLPPASVIGTERVPLDLVGRGAARVVSPVITPRIIEGRAYIAIDMGVNATRFAYARSGLAGLFNSNLTVDPRWLVAFARDISFLAPGQLEALDAPSGVTAFPAGLLVPNLQFSGVHEDGWIADTARFRLQLRAGSHGVRIAGRVGWFGALREGVGVTLLVDGEPVLRRRLSQGEFELRAELPESTSARWVEIRSDVTAHFPGDDPREGSLLLTSVELEGAR